MQRCLEFVAVFILLVVVILRPVVAETYDSQLSSTAASLQQISDPSPVRTIGFDLAILMAACCWGVARLLGRDRPYARTGLEWGIALVAIAAVFSCFMAGQKRLAINASIGWLCYPILAITLAQVLRGLSLQRIFLAAILATAAVQAFQCADQYLWGHEETWLNYQEIKEDFWASQDVPLDSSKVDSFEQRMLARESQGFMPHSNVAGAYLVLCGLAALGLGLQQWKQTKREGSRILSYAQVTLALALLTCTLFTKSLGATVSGIIALVAWIVFAGFRETINRHRTKAFLIGWSTCIAGGVAFVGHGLYHDSYPAMSLTFRWQYWKASAQMIEDHPFAGVGRENFDNNYLQYKSIKSPEEVANPHNLFVQATTDWGLIGLAGVMAMLLGVTWTLCGASRGRVSLDRITKAECGIAPQDASESTRPPNLLFWTIGLTLVFAVFRMPMLGSDDPHFLYYSTVTTGVIFAAAFALFSADGKNIQSTDADANTLRIALPIALLSLLIHEMINFALFVPGTATTFFALLGVALADRNQTADDRSQARGAQRLAPVVICSTLLIVTVIVCLVPSVRANHHLQRARATASALHSLDAAAVNNIDNHYMKAAEADPFDPTPHVERAAWLIATAPQQPSLQLSALRKAEASLGQAMQRNPQDTATARKMVTVLHNIAVLTESEGDLQKAIDAAEDARKLYPEDPKSLIIYANALEEKGRVLGMSEVVCDAITGYRQALDLDNKRLDWEELARLSEKERKAFQAKIKKLEQTFGTCKPKP